MNLFTDKELIIMASTIGFFLILIIIMLILDILEKNKNKNIEIKQEELEIEEIELEKKNDIVEEIEVLEIDSVKIEPVKQSFSTKEEAQIEIMKLEEELTEEFNLEDTITNLEAIEEENAIISYQELLENTSELTKVLADSGDEPITIKEVFDLFKQDNEEVLDLVQTTPLNEAYNQEFEATPLVSPINGLEFENLNEIQLENTANLEKLDKEIRKTNEFLNILNELKKNLD